MDFNIIKEANLEICESMYGLSINYLKKNENSELDDLLVHVIKIEKEIRLCNNMNALNGYIIQLNKIVARIEVIINE